MKMSKSLGNFVGVNEPAEDMFGKLMSISDELMARYYPLLLGRELSKEDHPLEAKKRLAFETVQTYHSQTSAQATLDEWNTRFSQKRLDDAHLPTLILPDSTEAVNVVTKAFADVFGVNKSRAEASRLIKQGSVQLDGEKILDPRAELSLKAGQVLRLDKTHAVRIG